MAVSNFFFPKTYVQAADNVVSFSKFHFFATVMLSVCAAGAKKMIKNPQWAAPLAHRVAIGSSISLGVGALLSTIFLYTTYGVFVNPISDKNGNTKFGPAGLTAATIAIASGLGCLAQLYRGQEATSCLFRSLASAGITSFVFFALIGGQVCYVNKAIK